MTPVAVAESTVTRFAVEPPAPPNTIEETGLHPDVLAQLLLKTLVAGEASGTGLSEKLRVPYSVLTRSSSTAASKSSSKSAARAAPAPQDTATS